VFCNTGGSVAEGNLGAGQVTLLLKSVIAKLDPEEEMRVLGIGFGNIWEDAEALWWIRVRCGLRRLACCEHGLVFLG
jgi:hypothetical protein